MTQARTAGDELRRGLREEQTSWQQLAGGTLLAGRVLAPTLARELTRRSLLASLALERAALERVHASLQVLDAKVQQRLGGLDQLPENAPQWALPADYDTLSARSISSESAHWSLGELLAALRREQSTKERSTVLDTLERRVQGLQQAS